MNTIKKQRGFIIRNRGVSLSGKEILKMFTGIAIILVAMFLSGYIGVQLKEDHFWLGIFVITVGVMGGWILGFWYMLRDF